MLNLNYLTFKHKYIHMYTYRGVGLVAMVIVVENGQTLNKAVCISHSVNTLGQVMDPIIIPPAMKK